MDDVGDQQLLREYAEQRSESAFSELVRRNVDFVFSAALRMVRDTHLAEDVTQGVFTALARNADQLVARPVLCAWLHRTTQNIAAQTVRSDVRRRAREQEAATMNEMLAGESDTAWDAVAPHLDAALGELGDTDREALLLRYFQSKSAREIAEVFRISEEAAQKRVNRAVGRLRDLFAKRGITVGAGTIAVLVSANAVQSAPAGLAMTVSANAGLSALSTTAAGITKTITMTILQKTLVAAVVTAGIGTVIFQHQTQSQLRGENESLRQQIAQLQTDNQSLSNHVVAGDGDKSLSDQQLEELLKLRGEVAVLRRQRSDFENSQDENRRLHAQIKAAQNQPTPQDQPTPLSAAEQGVLDLIGTQSNGMGTDSDAFKQNLLNQMGTQSQLSVEEQNVLNQMGTNSDAAARQNMVSPTNQ